MISTRLTTFASLLACSTCAPFATAQVTTRVSVDSSGIEGNGGSAFHSYPAITPDARYVAFASDASNLVAGDTNNQPDVFVHDRAVGSTMRASVDTNGVQGDAWSAAGSISADGRFVAFQSYASNLIPGVDGVNSKAIVHDLQTGATTLASQSSGGAAGHGFSPVISADGRFVAFHSPSPHLVAGDTNGMTDTFVHDRQTGTTVRVSVNSTGAEGNGSIQQWIAPTISADGRTVAFQSDASNLIASDTNAATDVFVHDTSTGTTSRVSVASSGLEADGISWVPSISADGRRVAFSSDATNLVPGDTNGSDDVFVHDRLTATTTRASVGPNGAQGNAVSGGQAISADGRHVAFGSLASNLVLGDTNGFPDTFVHDSGSDTPLAFCFGDGSGALCPCGNAGAAQHGCENSAGTGGAILSASGNTSLSADTLVLTSSGELPSVLSIFLQGDAALGPVPFGDGLRCVGGNLERLYVKNASGGVATAPRAGDPSVSARSAALGDPIPLGATRHYQTYYRDPSAGFCPSPAGNNWNVSSGLSVIWGG